MSTSFSQLSLAPAMISNLFDLGYESMTPIQAESLPHVLAKKDVIAQAKTGSGKTAAFGIGILTQLNPRHFGTQALVLCPTRELADQVAKELRRLARAQNNIKILTLCGGVDMGPQLSSLEHGAHIVVGTPGRILKHLGKRKLDLSTLDVLVLDEADRMLDMGFHDSMVEIIHYTPDTRQTLLFSATYSKDIRTLSKQFQKEPIEVTVESVHSAVHIEQHFYEIANKDRVSALKQLLLHFQPSSCVLFCNTKQRCEEVKNELAADGFNVLALHGDLEQRDRDQVLVQFANGSCPLLVATDVAARGLDIKDLGAVINVELAFDPEVHIHRIGRTGRAGQSGLALSLCAPVEAPRANAIQELQQQTLKWEDLPEHSRLNSPEQPRMATITILGGKKDKLRPGDILGALTKEAGLSGDDIGKIDIFDNQAYVAVDRKILSLALRKLEHVKIKGKQFKVRSLGR